jgi:hypothetical protein
LENKVKPTKKSFWNFLHGQCHLSTYKHNIDNYMEHIDNIINNNDKKIDYHSLQYKNSESKYSYSKEYGVLYESRYLFPGREINDHYNAKIFLYHSYFLTQDDFEELLHAGIYVKDYKKYNLVLNDKIQNICDSVLFYPYDEIKMTMRGYCNLLTNNIHVKDLIQIEKHFNIKPMSKCLKIYCCNDVLQKSVIEHFIYTHKMEPDLECLEFPINEKKHDVTKILYGRLIKDRK